MSIIPKYYKWIAAGFLLMGSVFGFQFISYDDWHRIRDNIIIFYAILMAALFLRSMRKFPLEEPAFLDIRQIDELAKQYHECLNIIHVSFLAAISVVILLLFGDQLLKFSWETTDQLLKFFGETAPVSEEWMKPFLSALTGAFAFAPLASLSFAYRFERKINALEVALLRHKCGARGGSRTRFRDRFEQRKFDKCGKVCRLKSRRRLAK